MTLGTAFRLRVAVAVLTDRASFIIGACVCNKLAVVLQQRSSRKTGPQSKAEW